MSVILVIKESETTYDIAARTFTRADGTNEVLTPIAGKVFILLAKNLDKCVERDEIFQKCWGEVIVTEQSLTNVISKLRKVLNTVCPECLSIKTISKSGYSLISSSDVSFEQSKPNENNNKEKKEDNTSPAPDKESPNLTVMANRLVLSKMGTSLLLLASLLTSSLMIILTQQEKPYYIDPASYEKKYIYGENTYYVHLPLHSNIETEETLNTPMTKIPENCKLTVFIRLFRSIDSPDSYALYAFILNNKGDAQNYIVSKYKGERSWDSLVEYFSRENKLCSE
ncbi:winged helix-turn-helix domain-containing protein [Vibrio vulnificus]|uniref:winged helix-turn-helix domain-containing protein n=1 Tax=Vibrio vulnificus TaxID=672 RepID=UPI0010294725|nr:winged helix-turn-helix domain-containing protein [Vibrio vulnificus]RZP61087.1 hypothetical protein D8T47_13735 [Vibrio vulnificus]